MLSRSRACLSLLILASALTASVTYTPTPAFADAFCFDSRPYSDARGYGVYISECDLQALLHGGSVDRLIRDGIGLAGQKGAVFIASLDAQLAVLQAFDKGKGLFVLTPWVGINAPVYYAIE